jgi:hypothetical protein
MDLLLIAIGSIFSDAFHALFRRKPRPPSDPAEACAVEGAYPQEFNR